MGTYNIFNKDNENVGCVTAKSEGHAKNKAVERKLVTGRKQISKVVFVPYDDPYEQTCEEIYG